MVMDAEAGLRTGSEARSGASPRRWSVLSVDQLVEQARQQAGEGTGEFQSRSFEEGLEVLARSINDCDRINPAGRGRLEGLIVDHLVRRLQVDLYLADNPDALAAGVARPVFVMGMPRTGTTAVINLLACDPARRTVLRWTLEEPVPPPAADRLYTDPRCLAALERQERALTEGLAGTNIRFEWADSPAECVHVMNHDFKAMQWEASAPMPAYTEFIYSCDMTSAYALHRRYLQVLQHRAPGPWALKGPSHALWLPTLLSIYPDARLVWTHRDPCTAVASLCSLMANAHRRNCDEADVEYLSRNVPLGLIEHVRRPMAMLDEIGDRIHHIQFSSLVGGEMAAMRRLYAWLGDELTPAVETRMRGWLKQGRQARLGPHRYTLEDFGLRRPAVASLFSDYVDRFEIPAETGQ